MQIDMTKAYCEESGRSWTMQEACERAVKHPAPRFYISHKQAFQIISPMMKGNFIIVDAMQDNRRRMYYTLFNVVLELSEKREFHGKSLWYIVQHAVCQPAPEFFVGGGALYKTRLLIKQGYIQEDGRCVGDKNRERAYAKLRASRQKMKELKAAAKV